jgi:hypothetical protein
MRITRGLFRLWVVASVLWIASVGVMTWQTWPADWTVTKLPFDPDAYLAGKPQPFDPSKPFSDGYHTYASAQEFVEAERRDAVMKGAAIGITPPVVVLLLGISLTWVVRGFRSEAS